MRGDASVAESAAAHWLVISDIHIAPWMRKRTPSSYGHDTNPTLLESLIAQVKRTEPDPPVVIIPGDFLGHGFGLANAAAEMAVLARRFDAAFPHAQFVIALGNNDSDCGDYEVAIDGPFLRAVARAWRPLVDRRGAAPDFARTFAHDGGYVATLPVPHLRAVVVNDVYDSIRYRNRCGTGSPAGTSLGDLDRALRGGPPQARAWIVTHVPPGIDAFSTAYYVHHLFVVPFMRPGAREHLVRTIDDPRNRVDLVIAGHTHHFSYRLSDAGPEGRDVPILVAPSVSPILGNAPSYLTLDVDAAGGVRNVAETSYLAGAWRRVGDLASEGVAAFSAPELARYQARLERDPALDARYERLYMGGAPSEITPKNFRVYWCAATALGASAEQACTASGGFGVFTARALIVAAVLAMLVLACAIALTRAVLRRRRRPRHGA